MYSSIHPYLFIRDALSVPVMALRFKKYKLNIIECSAERSHFVVGKF